MRSRLTFNDERKRRLRVLWRGRLLLAAVCLAADACASIERAALRAAAAMLERGRAAALDEPDWQLGYDAAAAQLKLTVTLLASDPGNRTLRRLAAEGFGGYAFLFVEDDWPARAKGLYLRGRDHALAALATSGFAEGSARDLLGMTIPDFEKTLKTATKDDVPDLFWAAFCWGGMVNLSKDDAAALADLPKVVALMTRAQELDGGFHFGGADLFFGVYFASRPPLLGGDATQAQVHFARAHRVTKGDYLMAHVLHARWYAVAVQDRALFKQLLTKVRDSPAGLLPEARLTDEAAKRKAAVLLEKIDDYF